MELQMASATPHFKQRESATMLSRVADSLYWMSRYLERAENTVRQLDVTMSLMLDTGGTNVETRWQRLLASLGKPAGMEWNGGLETMARARMPARYAKKSPANSGSASIASFTRCTRRMRKPSSVPASTTRWPRWWMAFTSSRVWATQP